ncbi:MAG: hypothetical protein H8D47_00380, partial [Planctomycetes bacterium]|nr:hypothetical protein [Planctomycetota bacterium]
IFSLWSGLALKSWRLQHACQIIKKQIEPIKDISEKIEAKNLCVKGLKKQFKTRGLISALFAELYKFSPQYISISQINFSADNYTADISIKGQSSTLSNALEYPSAMKKTQILKNMQITNVQQIPKAGTSIVEFKANCRVEQNGL